MLQRGPSHLLTTMKQQEAEGKGKRSNRGRWMQLDCYCNTDLFAAVAFTSASLTCVQGREKMSLSESISGSFRAFSVGSF